MPTVPSDGRVRLAVATTTEDVRDPRSWSGTPYSLFNALRRQTAVDVVATGPLTPPVRGPEAVRKAFYRVRSERYLWEREQRILRHYRLQLARRLAVLRPDVVLTLGTVAAAALPDDAPPVVVFSDTTFALNVDYYPTMTGVCGRSRRLGDAVDRQAFDRADLVAQSSEWAADSVVRHYGTPAERTAVVEMGAQHACDWGPDRLDAHVDARLRGPLRLLWIGVEWERKGGDVAVAVAGELHARGIPVELTIAGLTPPLEVRSLPYVRAIGFVDPRDGRDTLGELFASSFALLLPSRAENTSIVLADAASHALPSLASDTGGMTTMVQEGANGHVLPLDAPPARYADVVARYWADHTAYRALAAESRRRYEDTLNWDRTAARLVELATSLLPARSRA